MAKNYTYSILKREKSIQGNANQEELLSIVEVSCIEGAFNYAKHRFSGMKIMISNNFHTSNDYGNPLKVKKNGRVMSYKQNSPFNPFYPSQL